jgi:hypothetical protein
VFLKVLLIGGAADGRSGPYPYANSGLAERGQDPTRVFFGEHWGGLGEHWGPARQRYLQGPWYPHPEELDRYVKKVFVFLSTPARLLIYRLSGSFSSSAVHPAHQSFVHLIVLLLILLFLLFAIVAPIFNGDYQCPDC